ncbi:MAG: hypothetical protein U0Q18_21815 [Bryobacteraceae bacterium]
MNEPLSVERLAPAPRFIPPLLQWQLLLASPASQIGWVILGFGSIFIWGFLPHADFSGPRFRPRETAEVRGESLDCRTTRFTEGGSKTRRGTPIYENRYRYTIGVKTYESSSYAKGQCLAGGPVRVEYLIRQPDFSRVAGMRRKPLSPASSLIALFPATGLAMILAGVWKGRRSIRLLRNGSPAVARFLKKEPTRTRVNNRLVYRMTFEYTAQNGMLGNAVLRSNRPERLEKKPGTLLLYAPENLNDVVFVDTLPGRIWLAEAGQPAPGGSLAYLILPALAILGNLWYASHFLSGPR